ncbi:AAA family ATPase [Kitasatospora kifunensis]
MKRYILTGTPGAGKTTILTALAALGYRTVAEAATEVITAEQAQGEPAPWTRADFIDRIVTVQRERQLQSEAQHRLEPRGRIETQLHDRSPICTHALGVFLNRPVSPALTAELDRITRERVYQPQVFFVRNLGFCEPTAARRISFADSLEFERIHERSYRAFGFELIDVPAAPLAERVAQIHRRLTAITVS